MQVTRQPRSSANGVDASVKLPDEADCEVSLPGCNVPALEEAAALSDDPAIRTIINVWPKLRKEVRDHIVSLAVEVAEAMPHSD